MGGAIRNIGQPILLFMKNGINVGFTSWLAFYRERGGEEGLVVFTNYDAHTEPGWQPKVFTAIFEAAAKAMSWPDSPGLEDSGPPVRG